MRPFEALLMLAAAAVALRACLRGRSVWPGWSQAMLLVLVILLGLHLMLEGWRPQMLPAYAGLPLLLLALLSTPAPAGSIVRLPASAICLLMLAIAAGACVLRPVVLTPAPGGPFAVGTAQVALFADKPAQAALRIWYPAETGSGTRRAPYLIETRGGSQRRGRLGRDQARLDATLVASPARLPVLVFFPGWGCLPSQNTVLLQDLASHGYVVAAPDTWDPAAYPGDDAAAADLSTPLVFDSDRATMTAMRAGANNALRQAALARHVLDRLATLDRTDAALRFRNRLALDHAGMLGFSFGGSVAVQAALDEPRFRAIANLDGAVFTDAYARGFTQPYLVLSEPSTAEADRAGPDPAARREAVLTLQDDANLRSFLIRQGGMQVTIDGADHLNFQDLPQLEGWGRHGRTGGAIDPQRARRIVDDFLFAFFDYYLRGPSQTVPGDFHTAFPEVKLEVWTHKPSQADRHALVEEA